MTENQESLISNLSLAIPNFEQESKVGLFAKYGDDLDWLLRKNNNIKKLLLHNVLTEFIR
jgi:hypothetical protein